MRLSRVRPPTAREVALQVVVLTILAGLLVARRGPAPAAAEARPPDLDAVLAESPVTASGQGSERTAADPGPGGGDGPGWAAGGARPPVGAKGSGS